MGGDGSRWGLLACLVSYNNLTERSSFIKVNIRT